MADYDEPRLDVEGFVVDYFSWRVEQDGDEWYERPELPYGVQPEHKAMRKLCTMFESRRSKDLNDLATELMEDERLSFSRYCEVIDEFNRTPNELPRGMSYGRLIGLIAFGGVVAKHFLERRMRKEVQQIATYTSKFIDSRIREIWVMDGRSWANFMETARQIIRREEEREEREANERRIRRLSYIGIGAAIVGIGAFFGSRVLTK